VCERASGAEAHLWQVYNTVTIPMRACLLTERGAECFLDTQRRIDLPVEGRPVGHVNRDRGTRSTHSNKDPRTFEYTLT
jgi:hypothetical protein